jgi:hypothetical protein
MKQDRIQSARKPSWLQQPGETDEDFYARREASLVRWYASRGREIPKLEASLSAGVGTFDGNGNPKGSGWW